MAAAAIAGLDIAEPQVLVYYPNDPHFSYHQRVLLRRIADARWIVLTPDGEVEVTDLAQFQLIALARGGAVPAVAQGDSYLFRGLTPAELAQGRAAADRLAVVLGAPPVAPGGPAPNVGVWRISDTGSVKFCELVADDVLADNATGAVRGDIGLALVEGEWYPVQRVRDGDLPTWRASKQCGPGRDDRLGGSRLDASGRRYQSLSEALATHRPFALSIPDEVRRRGWPHVGPRAILEVLNSMRGLGREAWTYHDFYIARSGLHPESSIAWEHKCLLVILAMMLCIDQLDVTNLAAAEYLARRLVMIERVVRVNPRCPNFSGLNRLIEHSMDEGGGLATQEFTAHFAQVAEADARVLKQNRLLREERTTAEKSNASNSGKGGNHADGQDQDGTNEERPPRRRGKKG